MAKVKRRGGRVHNNNANRHKVARPTVPLHVTLPPITPTPNHDGRVFSFTRSVMPPAATKRAATRIVVDNFGKSVRAQTKAPLRFAIPQKVALCIRRKRRKEVIFATNKAGAGVKRKNPRRNFWSEIKC